MNTSRRALALAIVCVMTAPALVVGCSTADTAADSDPAASADSMLTSRTGQLASAPTLLARGYVRTPFGYHHASCTPVAEDDDTIELQADGSLHLIDGAGHVRSVGRCAYESFRQLASTSSNEPDISGWFVAGDHTYTVGVGRLDATMTVPAAPAAPSNDALLYFFPSVEPAAGTSILQPVLQWGAGPAGGGPTYGVTGWFVGESGIAVHGKLKPVTSGQAIPTSMLASSCNAAKDQCKHWSIAYTIGGKKSSIAVDSTKTPSVVSSYPWAQGGVAEFYGVSSCAQLPKNGSIAFTNIAVFDTSGKALAQSWKTMKLSATQPSCAKKVTVDNAGGSVTLGWSSSVSSQ